MLLDTTHTCIRDGVPPSDGAGVVFFSTPRDREPATMFFSAHSR